ncbi:hypothetical protein BG842_10530 [Haladaptatus sp. W1]|uniref:hypothetical protein n=1 Tax=Haladaptatus sp. W1 TaxID=1897478 RepID=UPI000849C5B6|nr:hypothetical protein [Haladaptatus sp. W1]ODR80994.1 hypothetical protein BG842_05130 [Haladaptatus sp. W1]ODR83550.1 hypothetical protein BG842_10530 [Haladaptatus sp. W1]
MSLTLRTRIDPIKIALGVFTVLGLALTGVAGYALLSTGGGSVLISANTAVALLSGTSLVVFVLLASKVFERRMAGRGH